MAGLVEGLVVVVDADADLSGHRNVRLVADAYDPLDDLTEQIGFPRQGGTAAAARDLRHRTAEVEVHMVGHVLVHHDARRLLHDAGVHPVQLQRADPLPRREAAQPQRLGIARHQRTGRDHLGHIQSVRAVFLAQHAERPVGHARHRREHHRGLDMHRPQIDRGDAHGGRRLRVGTWIDRNGFARAFDHGFL